jgi:hypothetical protein
MNPYCGCRHLVRACLFLVASVVLSTFGGCSSARTTEFEVLPGRYSTVFDAAREVLTGYSFKLDRVDAQLGVITTQPKNTSGLASLWDKEQSTVDQEVEDLLNQHCRVVRITFADEGIQREVIDPGAPLRARVEVIVYRAQSPGVRAPSRAISMTNVTTDPVAAKQGTGGAFDVPISQDSRLAARLAEAIELRAAAAPKTAKR